MISAPSAFLGDFDVSFSQVLNNLSLSVTCQLLREIMFPFKLKYYGSLLLLLACSTSQAVTCPPWTTINSNTSNCECKTRLLEELVKCKNNGDDLLLRACYCIGYSKEDNDVVVGECLFTCFMNVTSKYQTSTDHLVPSKNVTTVGDKLCARYKRKGFMCGECEREHAPAVFSYSLNCSDCSNYKLGWLKFVAVAFLPQTLLYFIIILLHLSVTSGEMVAYVAVSQMATTPAVIQFALLNTHIDRSYSYTKWIISLYSFWNLDIFRSLYPPICIHPKMTALLAVSLDYIVGIYPLLLILLTSAAITIHDRFRLCVFLFKPLTKILRMFYRRCNFQPSLVKGFATFLILSYVKILNVNFSILMPTGKFHSINGSRTKTYVWSDKKTVYFSHEHLPYAVVAILMLMIFNILPLILVCLYPLRCFQRCLSYLHLQHQALHTFMDTLQGCYRHKPRDYCYFAAAYLMLRILNLVVYAYYNKLIYFLAIASILTPYAVLVAIVKPYKKPFHNTLDVMITLLVIFVALQISINIEGFFVDPIKYLGGSDHIGEVLFVCLILILPIYGLLLLLKQLIPLNIVKMLKSRVKKIWLLKRYSYDNLEELPHRLENSVDYSSLH